MDQRKYEEMIDRLLFKTKNNIHSGNRREGYKEGLLAAVSMFRSEFKLPRPGTKGWMTAAELLTYWEGRTKVTGPIKATGPHGQTIVLGTSGGVWWMATGDGVSVAYLTSVSWRLEEGTK